MSISFVDQQDFGAKPSRKTVGFTLEQDNRFDTTNSQDASNNSDKNVTDRRNTEDVFQNVDSRSRVDGNQAFIAEDVASSKKRCFSESSMPINIHQMGKVFHVIHSRSLTWKIITILTSVVMIFFSPMSHGVANDKKWRPLFTTMFILTFLIISIDVLLKAIFDPEYFQWSCYCCTKACGNNNYSCSFQCNYSTKMKNPSSPSRKNHRDGRLNMRRCSVGSYFFWMDIIALLSFILGLVDYYVGVLITYEVIDTVQIPLNQDRRSFRYYLLVIIILIGRLAILARLFEASTVVAYLRFENKLRLKLANLRTSVASSVVSDDVPIIKSNSCVIQRPCFVTENEINTSATRIQRTWRSSKREDRIQTATQSIPIGSMMSTAGSLEGTASDSSKVAGSNMMDLLARHAESSRVGSAMIDLIARHVGVVILATLLVTMVIIVVDDSNQNETIQRTMLILHNQTQGNPLYSGMALDVARTITPYMYQYVFANGTTATFPVAYNTSILGPYDFLNVTINSPSGSTSGVFILREAHVYGAIWWSIVSLFVMFAWMWGSISLVAPVFTLVFIPIGRMIRLVSMLTEDPLGYQMSDTYKDFATEEHVIVKYSWWEKDVLEGMETSFLQNTMLRIGSLMNVGFGSAGVDIIRHYLLEGSSFGRVALHQSGSTVRCIFLFCDIRQFTDATEALQEDIFVFTNKIAFVVHSICHAYDGHVNKNIGDAFLITWRLPDEPTNMVETTAITNGLKQDTLADKALYSVIKIRLALNNSLFFLESIGASAKSRLLEKLGDDKGQVVRLGFGLHAGKAVQGAIGSQRKIDATYISEAVDRSEMLESLTKRYGLSNLMSNSFYDLLSTTVRDKCRKVDRVALGFDAEDDDYLNNTSEKMILYTFDLDIDALHQAKDIGARAKRSNGLDPDASVRESRRLSATSSANKSNSARVVDSFTAQGNNQTVGEVSSKLRFRHVNVEKDSFRGSSADNAFYPLAEEHCQNQVDPGFMGLQHEHFGSHLWTREDMRIMRQCYNDGFFIPTFSSALESYFNCDWINARAKFMLILERIKDGPSSYFLGIIDANNGHPFIGFRGYGEV